MDTKHLTTFVQLCKELNFTKAAKQLNYAQSSVSAQIKQLEAELDIHLFERINKSVILTPAGKEFYHYAVKILGISDDARKAVAQVQENRITLASAESLVITRLPSILKEFRGNYPDVEILLHLAECKDYISVLESGTADLLFSIGTPLQDKQLCQLISVPEPVSLYASPLYFPDLFHKPVAIEELSAFSFLLTSDGCAYRNVFLSHMKEKNQPVRISMEASSIHSIIQASICGLGLCVLPDTAVRSRVQTGELKKIAYPLDLNMVSQISYHKDKWISPLLSNFILLCKKSYSTI